MRVLAVDDDEIALELMAHALREAGYEVLTASGGQEALRIVRDTDCRLVISDWDMPDMTGVELCRQLRGAAHAGYLYFVLLTACNSSSKAIEGLSAGADDFMAKPFNPAELAVRVRTGERILSLETREVTIFALARLAESRDPETGAHLERVQSYARVLAQKLSTRPKFQQQVNAEYIRLVHQTSPLHDIGKVGVPDSVLLKQGKLSQREFEIMQSHTVIGAETLQAALEQFPGVPFLEMARDIALTHHERFDGTGYPAGLCGEDIPLCGRIVALADVYDALVSKRVYKDRFSHDAARAIILESSGSHFDPDIVDAFRESEEEFVAIAAHFETAPSIASRLAVLQAQRAQRSVRPLPIETAAALHEHAAMLTL
jgi:putative two-component system response regulator